MKRALAFALLLAACGGKPDVTDDFSGLGDEKSDSFSSKMTIVATLAAPQGSLRVAYTPKPLYRAVKLHAQAGDWVKITVRGLGAAPSPGGKVPIGAPTGDPVAFLLDAKFAVVAKNDDANDQTSDALIVTQLKKSGIFYVVMRDYDHGSFTFGVDLALARASGDLVADANTWFQFFIAGDAYGTLTGKWAVPLSKMPRAAQADASGCFAKDVGNATGYAFPYDGHTMYILTGQAEEAYDARPYDWRGAPISGIAMGGDSGEIDFGSSKAPPVCR
jgi:hypothetical protein